MGLQWNLPITALQTKDTSVIQTTIDGPKQLAIETCTYIILLVLRMLDPAPNGHIA